MKLMIYSLLMTRMQSADHNTSSEIDKQCKVKYWNSQLIAITVN